MKNAALQAHTPMICAGVGTPPCLDFITASLFGIFGTREMLIVVFILQTIGLFFIFAFRMNRYISSALSVSNGCKRRSKRK